MNGELRSENLETSISLGECFRESGTADSVVIKAFAGGRHQGVVMVELGENRVSVNGERLVLAIHAALGKSFIGTTWLENKCQYKKP